MEDLRQDLMEHVIRAVVPEQYLDDQTVYHLQPSGKFVIGGPQVSEYVEWLHFLESFCKTYPFYLKSEWVLEVLEFDIRRFLKGFEFQ